MAKFIIVGLWTCFIALGTLIFSIQEIKNNTQATTGKHSTSYERTNIITVPIMANGKVEGYIASQLIYLVDAENSDLLQIPLSIFINDEVFRIFFGAYSDTHDIRQVKFDEIKPLIINNLNRRFQKPVIQDLLVERFEFIIPS